MTALETLIEAAQNVKDEQLREILAMAKGMDAANKINEEERGA